jgi:N6-adenosine-specific RNA methylase IME4
MKLDDLKAIPVADYAARNCALFLWCPDAHLAQGMDLIGAWQFKFRTVGFNWIKTTSHGKLPLGCGWWTRAGSELCLLATRGQPRPLAYDVRRVVLSERREHSRKPDEIYDSIRRLVGGPYLELFARERRAGWSYALSPELDKFR